MVLRKNTHGALWFPLRSRLQALGSAVPSYDTAALFASAGTGGWWDYGDLSALSSSTAGAGAITTPGDRVGRCADKSGFNNHALADGDNTTRPVLEAGGGVVLLSGEGRRTTAVLSTALATTTAYGVMVVKTAVSEIHNARLFSWSSTAQQDWNSGERSAAMYFAGGHIRAYRATDNSSAPYTEDTTQIIETVYDGTNHTMYADGVAGTPSASSASFNFNLVGMGAGPNGGGLNEYCNATLYETLLMDYVPSASARLALRTHLISKWSI